MDVAGFGRCGVRCLGEVVRFVRRGGCFLIFPSGDGRYASLGAVGWFAGRGCCFLVGWGGIGVAGGWRGLRLCVLRAAVPGAGAAWLRRV